MELDWLKDFLTLAEQGNFSRAADIRNVTQPAFSRRIRALEDWAGTALFIRGAQGAGLTAAGRHFQPMVVDLVHGLDRARRETSSIGERQGRSLAIAATHALSFAFFPRWISRHVRFDKLGALNLVSESMHACEQIMLAGDVHFLLCHHRPDAPDRLDATRFPSLCVGHDTLVPLSAPDKDGRPMWPMTGAPAKPTRLLSYSSASGLGGILAAQSTAPTMRGSVETVFTSHLAATLQAMARDGEGVAWLPLTLAEDDVRLGRLVKAAADDAAIPIEIRLYRSPDCRNRAADELWQRLHDLKQPAGNLRYSPRGDPK